jgi:hypothetical protein
MNIAARLTGKQFNGYLRIRLPHELDVVVDQVVAAYRSATPAVRQAIVSDLHPRAAGVLSAYGERMAAIAVRSQSVEPLQRGLVAMGVADRRLEHYRTNLYVLAAVNHSAVAIGSDLPNVIDSIAPDLPEAALARFRRFTERSERDKSLQAFGLGVVGAGGTFRYGNG